MPRKRTKWQRRGCALAEFGIAVLASIMAALSRILGSAIALVVAGGRRRAAGLLCYACGRKPLVPGSVCNVNERSLTSIVSPVRRDLGFDHVIGHDDVKQEIRLRTILPLKHPRQAKAYGLTHGGNLLFWGPPGCGKTLLAEAVAAELDAVFFHVRPSDVMTCTLGLSERRVVDVFDAARSARRSVLFFDEVDALCMNRRRNRSVTARRVVSELLIQLDRQIAKQQADRTVRSFTLSLAATNWIESIDPAFLRPGRFTPLYIGLPGIDSRQQILEQNLRDKPVESTLSLFDLAERAEGYTAADVDSVVKAAARHAFLRSVAEGRTVKPITRGDFLHAFSMVAPSVAADELERYATLRGAGNGRRP